MNFSDENLLRFLDRELSDEESALVAKQIASDPALASRLAHFRSTSGLVRDASAELSDVDLESSWAHFESRLASVAPRKTAEAPKRTLSGRSRAVWGGALALAAAALIALFVRSQNGNRDAVASTTSNDELVGESDILDPSALPAPNGAAVASRVEVLEFDPGDEKSRVFEASGDGTTTTIIWMSDHAPN